MRIRDVYQGRRFGLSIEIFPPKSPEGDESLRQTLRELAPFHPAFISCTYGAGGSTRGTTLEVLASQGRELFRTARWRKKMQQHVVVTCTAHDVSAHRQPRLREGLTRAACRNELHAKAYQRLRKFHEASLIRD